MQSIFPSVSSYFFSFSDPPTRRRRSVAGDLQALVWQILYRPPHEKSSGQERQTIEENAAKPAGPEGTRQGTLQKAVPTEAGGGIPNVYGSIIMHGEFTLRST